jgi:hypothetical protein
VSALEESSPVASAAPDTLITAKEDQPMADADDEEIVDNVHKGTKQEGSSGTNIPCRSTLTR